MAGGLTQGRVVLGSSFTLARGEILDGDLVVMGGSVRMEPESEVRGDVVVFGGNVTSEGEIEGDVVVLGGTIDLREGGVVRGDVFTLGGTVVTAVGAEIQGDVVTQEDFAFPFDFRWSGPVVSPLRLWAVSLPLKILLFLFRTFMIAALATLIVMFWPEPTRRVAQSSIEQPLVAGGVGLLALALAPIALVAMVLTLILIPVIPLALLALVAAGLYGWVALGLEIGDRVAQIFKWDLHPAAAAGLGTFILTFVVGGVGPIPCVGWLAYLTTIVLAVGGVVLSRFGTQRYTYVPGGGAPAARQAIDSEASETSEEEGASA
jgi:cytoskeletal protein CcmA (bactofilin family)